MLWKSNPDKEEKWTPWVIGAFAIVVFAVATYMNYGREFFHPRTATDISATSNPKPAE
jgi:hypothetical protein